MHKQPPSNTSFEEMIKEALERWLSGLEHSLEALLEVLSEIPSTHKVAPNHLNSDCCLLMLMERTHINKIHTKINKSLRKTIKEVLKCIGFNNKVYPYYHK